MPTAREMGVAVGAVGTLRTSEGLYFSVRVVDVKEAWGDVRFQVVPVSGSARAVWVSSSRVSFPLPQYSSSNTQAAIQKGGE